MDCKHYIHKTFLKQTAFQTLQISKQSTERHASQNQEI